MRRIFLRALLSSLALLGLGTSLAEAQSIELVKYTNSWRYNDSGNNLGTAWTNLTYNDTAAGWSNGPGAFSIEAAENLLTAGPFRTMLRRFVNGTSAPQITNFYFRTYFNFTNSPAGVTLVATNAIDDGAVIYLNGREVGRFGMPAAPAVIDATTFATRADEISGHGLEILNIPASALVQGSNIVAVEIHQGSSGSSDAAFSMSLWLTFPSTGPARILTEPADQSVAVGQPVSWTAQVTGDIPYRFQWRKNGVNILNATNALFMINSAQLTDVGDYSFTVSNLTGRATSRNAHLSVVVPPNIILGMTNKVWRYLNTGADLGTAWITPLYNDSSWLSGPGPLGFETTPANLPIQLMTTFANSNVITYYFRTGFNFTGEPSETTLTFTNMLDDGAVYYINGVEVLRVGMPVGPVNSLTAAARTTGDGAIETATVSGQFLNQGTNYLAVEVHQVNNTSSDMVFGLSITATTTAPTPLTITNQPVDVVVEQNKPFSLSVGVSGNNARYQWYRENVAIAGATRSTFMVTNAALADAGYYHVVVSNAVSLLLSRSALVSVITDTNRPMLHFADGSANFTNITVSFTEPITSMSATNVANYVLSNSAGGAVLTINRAVLTNGTNVVLTTAARVADANYLLFARNIVDLAPAPNTIAAGAAIPVSTLIQLVGFDWQYDFYVPDEDFYPPLVGAAWRTQYDYDVSTWGLGFGAFVRDSNQEDLPVEIGTTLDQGAITTYYRRFVTFNGSPLGATLRVRHVIDDGAVFYLNGQEILRFNMPLGVPNGDTIASPTVGVASIVETNIPVEVLRFGTNLLAVEVHGTARLDEDMVYALQLEARVLSTTNGPVVIASGPANQTVLEGRSVIFNFTAVAATAFQWFTNNVAVLGGTNSTLTLSNVPFAMNGTLVKVTASNSGGSKTSGDATLTVIKDVVRPALVSAFGRATGVLVTFTENLLASSVANLGNYAITNTNGTVRTITGAVLTNGNMVFLTTTTSPDIGDILRVSGVSDSAVPPNPIVPNSRISVGFDPILIPWSAEWRFTQIGGDLGTAWRDRVFNSMTWSNGPALIGEESASLPFPLRTPANAPASGGPNTTYFRTEFSYVGNPANAMLDMSYVLDDGAVFYLNGQELTRVRMTNGVVVDFATKPSVVVGDAVLEGPVTLAAPSLLAGVNVLAAEVHQGGDNSSDLVFGVQLVTRGVASEVQPDQLRIIRNSNGTLTLTWSPATLQLQQSIALPGNWINVSGATSPYTIAPLPGAHFFRLAPDQ